MNHFASRAFWQHYHALPADVQELADKNFALLQADPNHPSLHFKKIGRFRSARVGLHYRALAVEVDDGLLWFWIGLSTVAAGNFVMPDSH
jgi:hypothetical protein